MLAAACGKGGDAGSAGEKPAPAKPAEPVETVEPSNLKSDEHALFIPTFATLNKGVWTLPLEVWVFEPEDDGPVRAASVKLVEEAFEAASDEEAVDEAMTQRVAENMRPFLVDNERNKTVVVQLGDKAASVGKTGPDGRASATVTLTAVDAEAAAKGSPPTISFSALLRPGDERTFAGRVHLLEDKGISVISDIDDTIKITEVHDKKRLLANTFAEPFRPTPGVADVYRRWSRQGAAFHYVSNSPLPLLSAIEEFVESEDYPKGSIQLKPFRWRDGTFIELFAAPEDHKQVVIEDHIERFLQRRFVLVGDTGERDPEIYAALRRKYGPRIPRIYLRDTGSMPAADLRRRMRTVFEGIPADVWRVFKDGSEIADDLPAR